MSTSEQQNYVILRDADALNSIPFGYRIDIRKPELPTLPEDDTDPSISVPHILDDTVSIIALQDGTLLADIVLEVESDYPEVELRIIQGEEL